MRGGAVRVVAIVVLVGLLATLLVLGGCKKEKGSDTPAATDEASKQSAETSATDPVTPADVQDGSQQAPQPNAPTTMTVRLYWVEAGENALGVERTIPYSEGAATAALNALLAGPTAQELQTWPALSSAIPSGTTLNKVTIENGIAKVDLSAAFESGGGTFSVTARLAQVVYTLQQFSTVQGVEFYIDGAKVTLFSGEGLELNGPQTMDDYEQLLPIDA